MFKISVYGKGGVGKSSVSSNLSFLLSMTGRKVLQVGCDPKHDSTRLLTNGVSQRTFMESLMDDGEDAVIETGSNGISCIECGGAEPGVGCAGKGMISMFNFLERNTPPDTDVRICDVLGDVVCGGFSVPMRRGQTDGIILVVSEDFMSIYAANNILRGIRNLNGSDCIIGLVLNSRKPEDRIRVDEFSAATGIPIIGTVSASGLFSEAEARGSTVAELFPGSETAKELLGFTENVISVIEGRSPRHPASPLNENAMTQIAAKQKVTDLAPPIVRTRCRFDTVDRERGLVYKGQQAMPACTSHGAVEALLSIRDAAIVLHGPRNCAFLMEYAWLRRSHLMRNSRGRDLPDNLFSTGMNGGNVFTGDRGILRDTIRNAIDKGFGTVFVVQTCTSDTIGTDVYSIISEFESTGAKVIPVEPDEYFLGSKFGGFGGGVSAMVSLVDRSLPVEKGTVSLLAFEPNILSDRENVAVIEEVLGAFGLVLKTVFFDDVTVEEIRGLATSEFFIQLGIGHFPEKITRALLGDSDRVMVLDPPVLLAGVEEWCDALGEATGKKDVAEALKLAKRRELQIMLEPYRPGLEGKRVAFYQRAEAFIDPCIDLLGMLGIQVVARISWVQKFVDNRFRPTRHTEIPLIRDVELCHLAEEFDKMRLDILLSADPRTGRTGRPWTTLVTWHLGLQGAMELVDRLDNCIGLRPLQKWKEADI